MCYFQPEFHLSKHYDNKFIRPDLESPWSVDFKAAFTFKIMTCSGVVTGCQKYFTISPKCPKRLKKHQICEIFKWNSTYLNISEFQKKSYPHFLYTKSHSKNNSHKTQTHFCFFQLYLIQVVHEWYISIRGACQVKQHLPDDGLGASPSK